MSKKIKISSTAYRVLLLLMHLNNGQCKSERLNDIFLEDEYVSRYFSKDVILKYIITLRTAGYNISKPAPANNYSYELNKSPVLIELSNRQIKNIAIMYWHAEGLHQNKITENYGSFLQKIKKFIPENQVQLLNKELKKQRENPEMNFFRHSCYEKLIKKIESFIEEGRRVSIKYCPSTDSEEKQIVLEISNIKYDKKEVYVSGYSPLTEQTHAIKLEHIVDIKQLPIKSQYSQIFSPVIFKLKGQLAKIYRPYENEKVAVESEKSNTLTVTSYTDDKDMLLKRLLKYGENCEILYPKYFQNQIISTIEETLKNYN